MVTRPSRNILNYYCDNAYFLLNLINGSKVLISKGQPVCLNRRGVWATLLETAHIDLSA